MSRPNTRARTVRPVAAKSPAVKTAPVIEPKPTPTSISLPTPLPTPDVINLPEVVESPGQVISDEKPVVSDEKPIISDEKIPNVQPIDNIADLTMGEHHSRAVINMMVTGVITGNHAKFDEKNRKPQSVNMTADGKKFQETKASNNIAKCDI